MAPDTQRFPRGSWLTPAERERTIRWLVQNQTHSGGFSGRTNKLADACYCFWCGATLSVSFCQVLIDYALISLCFQILGAGDLVDERALVAFLTDCQFKFGGISKAPGERPGWLLSLHILPPKLTYFRQIHTTRTYPLQSFPSYPRAMKMMKVGSFPSSMPCGMQQSRLQHGLGSISPPNKDLVRYSNSGQSYLCELRRN